MEIDITYSNVKLRVVGDYQPAERSTFFYPGCAEWFEVSEIYAADSKIDLCDMLDDASVESIAIAVLEQIQEIRDGAN